MSSTIGAMVIMAISKKSKTNRQSTQQGKYTPICNALPALGCALHPASSSHPRRHSHSRREKDRIIFDASFRLAWDSLNVNSWSDPDREPKIKCGDAFEPHSTRIWNLRITYPDEDIYLWDDDIAGAFRLIRLPQRSQPLSKTTCGYPPGKYLVPIQTLTILNQPQTQEKL